MDVQHGASRPHSQYSVFIMRDFHQGIIPSWERVMAQFGQFDHDWSRHDLVPLVTVLKFETEVLERTLTGSSHILVLLSALWKNTGLVYRGKKQNEFSAFFKNEKKLGGPERTKGWRGYTRWVFSKKRRQQCQNVRGTLQKVHFQKSDTKSSVTILLQLGTRDPCRRSIVVNLPKLGITLS